MTLYDSSRYFPQGKFSIKMLGDDILNTSKIKTAVGSEDLYLFTGGVYKRVGKGFIKAKAAKMLSHRISSRNVNEVIFYIQAKTYTNTEKIVKKNLVNMKNGLYNLDTKELEKHDPDLFITSQLPVKYDPDATCPEIKKFFADIVEEKNIQVLEEAFGYCLFRDHPIHRYLLFVGSGANGRSTLMTLLGAFLGKENITSISMHELCNNPYATAQLYSKHANICTELPSKVLYQADKLKAITGGDLIGGQRKYGQMFEFVSYAKNFFLANKIPRTEDRTYAFWRRVVKIMFPYTFKSKDEQDGSYVKLKDTNILDKLTTPEELSGLFNLAVLGLNRLMSRGDFSYFETPEQVEEDWMRKSNPVYSFVKDCLVGDTEAYEVNKDVYQAFLALCEEIGATAMSSSNFGKELKKELVNARISSRVGQIGTGEKVTYGIKLVGTVGPGEKEDWE